MTASRVRDDPNSIASTSATSGKRTSASSSLSLITVATSARAVTRRRTSLMSGVMLGRTFGSKVTGTPVSDASTARAATASAPGARVAPIDPTWMHPKSVGAGSSEGSQVRSNSYVACPASSIAARAVDVSGRCGGSERTSMSDRSRWSRTRSPVASSPICVASTVGTPSRAHPTAMFSGDPPGQDVVPSGVAVTSTSDSPTTRSEVNSTLEIDRRVRHQLLQPVHAADLADGAATRAHDDRLRRGCSRSKTYALHQLAVGDARGDEEAVVAGYEVVGRQHAVEVVAGGGGALAPLLAGGPQATLESRKRTRLNSSHLAISYAGLLINKKTY